MIDEIGRFTPKTLAQKPMSVMVLSPIMAALSGEKT
jgi:hypothetical protein